MDNGETVTLYKGCIMSRSNLMTWSESWKGIPHIENGLAAINDKFCFYETKQDAIDAVTILALLMDGRLIPWWKRLLPISKFNDIDNYVLLWMSLKKDDHHLFGVLSFNDNKEWIIDLPTTNKMSSSDGRQHFQRIQLKTNNMK